MIGCRLTHPRHNALLPLLLGLELHQVASSVNQTHCIEREEPIEAVTFSITAGTCVFAVSQRPVNAVAMWETNFV